MQISPISMRGAASVAQSQLQPQEKTEGCVGKAIASGIIPGLGQMCDGRVGTGFKYLGGFVAAGVGAGALNLLALRNLCKSIETNAKSIKVGYLGARIGAAALGITSTVLYICSIVDAYRGKKA